MKQVMLKRFGGPEVLTLIETAKPKPRRNEVLVQNLATSINGADVIIRTGHNPLKKRLPQTVGLDVVGRVVKVGASVKKFAAGDLVWGNVNVRNNACAQYVAIKSKNVSLMPKSIDYVHAAALPTTVVTALVAMKRAKVKAHQRVLIRGIGGVGLMAVQIARAMGATVVALGSKHGQEVKKLGASEFFDYHLSTDRELGKFDVILDTTGKDLTDFQALIKPNGRLYTIAPVKISGPRKVRQAIKLFTGQKRIHFVVAFPTTKLLAEVANLVDSGKITPIVDSVYGLNQIVQAHERFAQHGLLGKVIVKIAD